MRKFDKVYPSDSCVFMSVTQLFKLRDEMNVDKSVPEEVLCLIFWLFSYLRIEKELPLVGVYPRKSSVLYTGYGVINTCRNECWLRCTRENPTFPMLVTLLYSI